MIIIKSEIESSSTKKPKRKHYYCTLNVAATFVKFAMLPPMINTFPVKHYVRKKLETTLKIHTVLDKPSSYLQDASP